MKQLEINNLQKIFGIFEAVKKINFSISENQTVALLGPNGCGKTTTIAMILGLITPTSGTITINNKILTKDHHYLAKMNFASPYVELPKKLKVIENLKVFRYALHPRQCSPCASSKLLEDGAFSVSVRAVSSQ